MNGLTCWEMLGALIAWEYGDADLQAEHFLTLASYNLQHPAQFSEATLAGLQAVFVERLDHGLGIAEIRRVGKAAAGAARVLKPEPGGDRTARCAPGPSENVLVEYHT